MNNAEKFVTVIAAAVIADLIGFGFFVYPTLPKSHPTPSVVSASSEVQSAPQQAVSPPQSADSVETIPPIAEPLPAIPEKPNPAFEPHDLPVPPPIHDVPFIPDNIDIPPVHELPPHVPPAYDPNAATPAEPMETMEVPQNIDLTEMSPMMVFTTAMNFTGTPSKYAGRSIRVAGTYTEFTDENGNVHHAILVKDAMGCCAQGLEFELASGDYPSKDEAFTISGILGTYKAPDPHLPSWVDKNDPRYDGVLNVSIIKDAVIE